MNLEEIEASLQSQFNVSLLKIIGDALAHWEYDLNQPGISEIDRIISHIPTTDFYEWYRVSAQLTRVAEHIQEKLRERLATLIDNESRKSQQPLTLIPVRYLKGALILDIDGIVE